MIDNVDMNQISAVLSQLVHNYNELCRQYYEIFYDTKPRDIEMMFFDEDGNEIPFIIPNRAKDKAYAYNGHGTPEGKIDAPTGAIYQDLDNGRLYTKKASEGATGTSVNNWEWVRSLNDIYTSGPTEPDNNYKPAIGNLYSNTTNGSLYAYTNKGWQQVGASGFATEEWCNDQFENLRKMIGAGVVHREGDETSASGASISGDKEFTDNVSIGTLEVQDTSVFYNVATFKKLIMGTAYRALSADIAEYYEGDEDFKAGTLVAFGGKKELTKATKEVNGVVSTDPAYILNGNDTMEHPTLLALSGRIPVRVIGSVKKFDKICLSEIDGVAKVDNSCYNPIGRALEDNPNEDEKLVECVVKVNL